MAFKQNEYEEHRSREVTKLLADKVVESVSFESEGGPSCSPELRQRIRVVFQSGEDLILTADKGRNGRGGPELYLINAIAHEHCTG